MTGIPNASRSALDGLSAAQLKLLVVELQRKFAVAMAEGRQEGKGAIAIIGMAGRYPGADGTLSGFWRMMEAGRSAAARLPADGRPFSSKAPERPISAAAFCDGIAAFDNEAFGIPVGEARMMDPQLRVALETAWTALEDAGLGGAGAIKRTGVFLAVATNDFADLLTVAEAEPGGYFALGNSHGLFAGRLSRQFGLTGPSLAVNSACSSALVAANEAIRALRQGECDAALVGGVNAILIDTVNRDLSALNIVSATARCRPFDAEADGYLRGEGCGFVVLRLAEAARRDGQRVIAEIRGLAMNHDGAGNVLTPSRKAQAAAMKAALREAGASPAEVVHVEAGSIGAPLADAAEGAALAEAYGGRREAPLEIGTVKPLIGHLEAAAGVAALTRAALMVSRRRLLPHPDIDRLNPHMDWDEAGLAPARAARNLPDGALVAVNAASLSGTNVHLLLAAAAENPVAEPPPGARPFLLSARSAEGLVQLAGECAARLRDAPEALHDLAYTFMAGRSSLPWRAGVVATDAATVIAALEGIIGARVPAVAPDIEIHFLERPPELPGPAHPQRDAALASWAALGGAPGDAEANALASLLAAGALLRRAGAQCQTAGGEGLGFLAAAAFVGLIDAAGAMALLAARKGGQSSVPGLTLSTPRFPLAGGVPADAAALLNRSRSARPEAVGDSGLRVTIRGIPSGAAWAANSGERGFAALVTALFCANARLDLGALGKLFGGRIVEAPLPAFVRRDHWPAVLLERWGPIGAATPRDAAPRARIPAEEARALLALILEEEAGVTTENSAQSLMDAGASSVEIMRALARMEHELGFSPDLDAFIAEPSLDGLVRQYLSDRPGAVGPATGEDVEEGWI